MKVQARIVTRLFKFTRQNVTTGWRKLKTEGFRNLCSSTNITGDRIKENGQKWSICDVINL